MLNVLAFQAGRDRLERSGGHCNDHNVPLEVGMGFLKESELPTVNLKYTYTHTHTHPTQTHTHKDIIGKGLGGR